MGFVCKTMYIMKKKLTLKEWQDVADLCEQGASQALDASFESHSPIAVKRAAKWMNALATKATKNALRNGVII